MKEQNSIIFEPIPLGTDYQFNLPAGGEEVFIGAGEGVDLNGFLFRRKNNKELILYFQGNAKNLQNWIDTHSMALDWGFDVLVTDYRGFGKSSGEMNGQEQMFADADVIYDFALNKGYQSKQIILYGYSMGSSMACHLASTKIAKGLILESPYSSIAEIDWVGNKAPAYPLENKEMAKKIDMPTLIVHGDQDDVITMDHAQRIYDNLNTKTKKLIILAGGGHGDLRSRSEYKDIITTFVNAI